MNIKALSRRGSHKLAAVAILSAASVVTFAAPPTSQPLFEQFDDVNPCTDEIITLTFTGTAFVQSSGDHFILRASGTVTTSDGFEGSFNRNFVVIGDRVETLRFHDMELSDGTGQRVIAAVGLVHVTRVDGVPVVDLVKFPNLRCVGRAT
jgi:hypothetical protein